MDSAQQDWRWQMAHRVRTVVDMESHLTLSDRERRGFAVPGLPAVAVTPYYLSLMDPNDARCPIRQQALPHPDDVRRGVGERTDPLGERDRMPVPGLIHRYPDRAVLLVAADCPVRCRHCNRRRRGPGELLSGSAGLDEALRYLRGATGVREVILSGGDPLTLDDATLDRILGRLRSIEHIEVLRVHTRAPVTCPMRVTDDLTRMLAAAGPLYVLTQFNHPREVTPEAAAACARLVDAGLPMANQSVLLRGINSDVSILSDLSRALLRSRVRPYYLFQLDPVVGSERFRTPVAAGLDLVSRLRGRVSGLSIPTFALDAPGGFGKVAVAPQGIVSMSPGEVRVQTWQGEIVAYPDTGAADLSCAPWPKNSTTTP
jgi:lysine 2,3-aminomutase